MDNVEIGPATPPETAAYHFYQEAMRIFRERGDREDVMALMALAQSCALVGLAHQYALVTR